MNINYNNDGRIKTNIIINNLLVLGIISNDAGTISERMILFEIKHTECRISI